MLLNSYCQNNKIYKKDINNIDDLKNKFSISSDDKNKQNTNVIEGEKYNNSIGENSEQELNQIKDNVLATNEEEAIKNTSKVINNVELSPDKAVDKILELPTKNINIGIIVSGDKKYSSITNSVIESSMITNSQSVYKNTGKIKIYNIGKLPLKNWEENNEIKKLINDNNDVIIGAVLQDTTEKILKVIPQTTLFISLIGKDEMTKQYPNLTIATINDSYRFLSLFEYLKDYKREFLSLILPSTKKGYQLDKMIRKIASKNDINVVNVQFYEPSSKASILASAKGVLKRIKTSYIIDENGKFITENYKENKKKKNNKKIINDERKTIVAETNSIYVEAEEDDLKLIISELDNFGILNKDIQIFSNAIFNPNYTQSSKLDNVYFIGYNYNMIGEFSNNFYQYFSHSPNYSAFITYDILSMLYYISNEEKLLPKNIHSVDGFRGMLDEFRFTREGLIERRFSIYQLRNGNITRIFVPNDYISSSDIEKDS